ncbi:glycosyltransferase family 39 protein [Marinicauda salina]|uniref:Glycosyltransferase family 39 protein n=1 Tax=Marinicauda salina TaxID=2135793 RepID=A0A2U2BV34_9PROT|nr:glycosyltransferase family 39 protein [Marinicauda salina]PWE17891.1 glycosyltransferase family 39 protein [Marinicauda salina]
MTPPPFPSAPGAPDEIRLSPRAWLVLIALAFVALAPGVFSVPPMDRDEARYAQATSQMWESGDFIDIRFQDEPRYVKPVGIYWMQVVTTAPWGADAPIGAHRLPSLFGALLAVAATAWLTARFYGSSAGFAAGLILALCFAMQIESRTAKTDAALLAAGVFAQGALMMLMTRVREARPAFIGWPAVFWAAHGAALLIKGPIILMVSVLTLVGYVAWTRDWRALGRLRPLPGVGLALAIFLPWVIAITAATGGDFLQESVGHALLGKVGEADDSHGGPFGYHTLLSPVTLWPGAALLGLAGLYAWSRRGENETRFLIAWILPTWLVFELVQTKLPHYVLPTFPAIAMLAALAMVEAPALLERLRAKLLHGVIAALVVLVGLVLSALPVAGAWYFDQPIGAASWIASILGLTATVSAGLLAVRPSPDQLLATGVATAAFYAALFGVAIPGIDAMWPSDRVADLVDRLEGCETVSVATAGYREPSNVFHFGSETALTDGPGAAAHLLADPACGIAVVDIEEADAFFAVLREAGAGVRTLGRVDGHNMVKGAELSLTVFVLEGSRLRLAGEGG